jgi:lipopolysaccharide/colanic/teichoic acid biosynthesis glycosyltransferase
VDLSDPAWRRVLTVRPGLVSLAGLRMARTYNASDARRKLEGELDYVARQSLRFDALVLARFAQGYLSSRGNVKARGEPRTDV